MDINRYIDYTNLKAVATKEDIKKLCDEAIKYGFASVCVNPCYAELAHDLLDGTNVSVCTVVGFPLGANKVATKEFEAIAAIEDGADEIDMVINIGALKDKDYDYVKEEIETVRDSIGGKVLKVIVETCYLTDEELKKATEICNETFVNFIKTSTGFGTRGASIEDIKIINENKNEVLEIKAAGGIRTYEEVMDYIDNGVTRIGMSNVSDLVNNHCDCEECNCGDDCNCEHECHCEDCEEEK